MSNVKYSKEESELYGFKIGRLTSPVFDVHEVKRSITDGKYDLLKVRVKANDPELYVKLEQLNMPYVTSDIIYHYKIDFRKAKYKPYIKETLFLRYDGTQTAVLKETVRKIFQESPGAYYLNPQFDYLIDEELRIKSMENWATTFNHEEENYKKKIWLAIIDEEVVGVMAAEIRGNDVEAVFAGVIPEKRRTGIYIDLIRFIQNYPISIKARWGYCKTQVQNIPSHRFFIREDMTIQQCYVTVQINGFLSAEGKENREEPVENLSEKDLQDRILSSFKDRQVRKFYMNFPEEQKLLKKINKLVYTTTDATASGELTVIKGTDDKGEIIFTGHVFC